MDYWQTLLIEEERKVEIAIKALEKMAEDESLGAQQLAKETLKALDEDIALLKQRKSSLTEYLEQKKQIQYFIRNFNDLSDFIYEANSNH